MTEFRPGRFQVLPPVVKNIVIINVLMVVAQFVLGRMGIDLADYLGLHYWRSSLFRPWQLVTHMFMHGSVYDLNATVLHIFSNMFALWMFGSILENIWGPKRFLTFYFVCGIGAALCHMAVTHIELNAIEQAFRQFQQNPTLDQFVNFFRDYNRGMLSAADADRLNTLYQNWQMSPGSREYSNEATLLLDRYIHGWRSAAGYDKGIFDIGMVGASGAVFGVLFAFGYLFPNTMIMLYFFVPVKAKYFVAFYALFELYAIWQANRGGPADNVAHFAHLGGMLFAFILLRIWKRNIRNRFY